VSVLVDTSVWIEFLRATGSSADRWLSDAVRADRELAWTEPVLFELLVGATSERHAAALKASVVRGPAVLVAGLADFEAAASLARQARAVGRPIRSTVDCLIAAVAIRTGMAVATVDRDFHAIAEVAPLELVPID